MSAYGQLAKYYDRLDIAGDDSARFGFALGLFPRGATILDAGCGTGEFTLRALKKGFSTVSVDLCADMLAIAASKAARYGERALFLNQNLTKLDLYGTVGGCVCLRDTLNHLAGERELSAAVARIALFCESGAYFVFDVNTEYKHRAVLADNSFVIETDGLYCCWQSALAADGSVELTVDVFEQKGGVYIRSTETFREHCFSPEQIEKTLSAHGFELSQMLDGDTLSPPCQTTGRLLYAARRI